MEKKTLSGLRRDYSSTELSESAVDADPFAQFSSWLDEAFGSGELDANAMTVSTVDSGGRPSARVVLLKGVEEGGFVFFTNYESKKATDLAGNENVFLHFFWPSLHRQISVSGSASKITREEAEEYFATRPRESQAGAWASAQSSVLESRGELEDKFAAAMERFEGQAIPCPPFWGGYRVTPDRFEFWQGRGEPPARPYLLYIERRPVVDNPTCPVIETERLFFRELTHDDLPWLIEMRSPEPVNRYLGGTKMQNPESLAKRLQFYIDCYDKFGFGNCAMGLKEAGELIGTSGLQPLEDTGEIEVGYNLSERFWRQGYGYECAYGWLKHGFESRGLERIVAVSYPENVGSWRIMEKCGMHYEKTEPHYGVDCVFYAITHEEFLKAGEGV